MALKDRVVEIAYRLRDDFTKRVGAVTGSFRKVDEAAAKSDKSVGLLSTGFLRLGRAAQAASLAIKATVIGAVAALAAQLVSAITSLGSFRQELDETAKAARSLGTTTENLTGLQYAAELSGLAVDQLSKGLQNMVRTASEAADGVGTAAEVVGELGLNAAELEKLDPADQLAKIADALSEITNQSDRVRLAEKLFGSRNAQGFLVLLEQGSAGLRDMTEAARELGRVYSDSEAAKVEEFNDRLSRMGALWDAVSKKMKLSLVNLGNASLEAVGVAPGVKDRLAELNAEIERTETLVRNLQEHPTAIPLLFGDIDEARIRNGLDKLKKLRAERDKILSAKNEQQANRERERDEREHNRKMAALLKEGTEGFKQALSERKAAYAKAVADLRTLQAQEKAIAGEFAQFVKEIQFGPQGQEAPTFFGAAVARTEAQRAFNQGDFDAAIEKARKAKELVEALKAEGKDSTVSLLGLAKSIERIATAAAGGKVAAKQSQIEEQRKVIQDIETRLKNLPKVQIKLDDQALQAEMARIQRLLDQRPLRVKVEASERVSGFGSQSDLERMINEEAMKRGTR